MGTERWMKYANALPLGADFLEGEAESKQTRRTMPEMISAKTETQVRWSVGAEGGAVRQGALPGPPL